MLGGFVVFLIMNFGVVAAANAPAMGFQKQLEESAFGAGRLLDEAKAFIGAKQFDAASSSLATLIERHPTSTEATEGRALASALAADQAKQDAAWAVAVVGIRSRWVATEATRLRAELEKDLPATVAQNWSAAEPGLRAEWARTE